ncbi:MAG: hypothetical protein PVH88_02240 [Ignavibacteria bacterium]|jgi:hypothetical protein
MKKVIYTILSFFIIFSFEVFGGAEFNSYEVESSNGNIVVKWSTGEETNLSHFVVTRRTPNSDFGEIAIISSKGSNSSYEYVDENAYKTSDAVYVYQVLIVDNDGKITKSKELTIAHIVSSVKRTWGSIKALFR